MNNSRLNLALAFLFTFAPAVACTPPAAPEEKGSSTSHLEGDDPGEAPLAEEAPPPAEPSEGAEADQPVYGPEEPPVYGPELPPLEPCPPLPECATQVWSCAYTVKVDFQPLACPPNADNPGAYAQQKIIRTGTSCNGGSLWADYQGNAVFCPDEPSSSVPQIECGAPSY